MPWFKSGAAQVGAVASTVREGGRGANTVGNAMKTAARNFNQKEIERKLGMVTVARQEAEAVAQGYASGAKAAQEALASAAKEKEKAEKERAEAEKESVAKAKAVEEMKVAEEGYKAEMAELTRLVPTLVLSTVRLQYDRASLDRASHSLTALRCHPNTPPPRHSTIATPVGC